MSTFRKLHSKGFRRLTLMIAVMALLATTFTGCFGKDKPEETENNTPPNLIQTETTPVVTEPAPTETEAPRPKVTVNEAGDQATITGGVINVLDNADAQAKIVGYLQDGETVDILRPVEINNVKWAFIRSEKNVVGWLCLSNDAPMGGTEDEGNDNQGGGTGITPVETRPGQNNDDKPAEKPTEKPAEKPNNEVHGDKVSSKGIVTGSELNVRERPTTDSDRVDVLKRGTRVNITEQKDGWGKIKNGWISLKYVYIDGTNGKNTAKGVVSTDNLNVRTGPGTEFDRATSYNSGTRVQILEQITVGDKVWGCTKDGWIAMNYVYIDGTKGEDSGTGTITGSELNIRTGPGTNFGTNGSFNKGDKVEILHQMEVNGKKWGCIKNGWISMDYVDMDD